MTDQIDVNYIADVLNNKMDLPVGVGQDQIDYVVAYQKPTAGNNYTWYRKYKSGWVEQGGIISTNDDAGYVKILPIEMADTNYYVNTARRVTDSTIDINARWCEIYNVTTTSFTTWGKYSSYPDIFWEVKGMSAQS